MMMMQMLKLAEPASARCRTASRSPLKHLPMFPVSSVQSYLHHVARPGTSCLALPLPPGCAVSAELHLETLPLGHEYPLESLRWGAQRMFRNGAVVVDEEVGARRSVPMGLIWWRGGDLRVLSRSHCGAPSRRVGSHEQLKLDLSSTDMTIFAFSHFNI